MIRIALSTLGLAVLAASTAPAQDKVTYRDKAARGGAQTLSGKIDRESVAGVTVGNRAVPGADILDIQYDVPPAVKLDYPKALAAESRAPADAVKEYEALLRHPQVQANKAVRRHFQYKVAAL